MIGGGVCSLITSFVCLGGDTLQIGACSLAHGSHGLLLHWLGPCGNRVSEHVFTKLEWKCGKGGACGGSGSGGSGGFDKLQIELDLTKRAEAGRGIMEWCSGGGCVGVCKPLDRLQIELLLKKLEETGRGMGGTGLLDRLQMELLLTMLLHVGRVGTGGGSTALLTKLAVELLLDTLFTTFFCVNISLNYEKKKFNTVKWSKVVCVCVCVCVMAVEFLKFSNF